MFDSIKPIVRQDTRRHGATLIDINYFENYGDDVKGNEQAYLVKFYTDDTETPIFSKIGTTKCTCNTRIRREIAEYREIGFNILSVDICKIVQCGELPAESVESYLRALLMKKYPNTWHKNDRFFNCDVSTELFTNLCEMYLSM